MEECPVDHKALLKDAWEMHGKAQSELRTITEDGAVLLAESITESALEADPSRARAAAEYQISPMLPYGETEQQFPPDIFGSIEKTDSYAFPKGFIGRMLQLRRHSKTLDQKRAANETGEYYFTFSPKYEESIPEKLKERARRKTIVDQDKWALYQEAAELQKLQGAYTLEYIQAFRESSTQFLYEGEVGKHIRELAVGHAEYFKAAFLSHKERTNTPGDFVVLPVGVYGKDFTERLMRSTILASQAAHGVLGEWSEGIAQNYPDTIMHSMRVRSGRDDEKNKGVVNSFREGVLSIAQTISLLTAEKIPGYDTGEALTQALVDEGIVEQFTKSVPMGFVAPVTYEGLYIPNLLRSENGKLCLDPEAMTTIKDLKRLQLESIAAEWATYNSVENPDPKGMPVAFGLVCPAAMPHGAITRILSPMAALLHNPRVQDKDVPVSTSLS